MTTNNNLLVDLFVEELPPKALKKLGDAFATVLRDQLIAQGLADAGSVLTAYASPRRLAAHLTNVLAQAADKAVSQKLMPVTVGLDAAGQATPALLKRLAALGADAGAVPGLQRAMDGKAERNELVAQHRGECVAELLQRLWRQFLDEQFDEQGVLLGRHTLRPPSSSSVQPTRAAPSGIRAARGSRSSSAPRCARGCGCARCRRRARSR
jgi:glycyl-tRNA synthetase beta subunit